MKIFLIGGTGLLGSAAAQELIERGHQVSSIALPPAPVGAALPAQMKIEYGNYLMLSDEEIRAGFDGCDGFVFAAGVDERIEGSAPIYELFKKYNIAPIRRLLRLAKETGVKHTVILGSYFAHFDKLWPHKELSKWHPYIRSRREQENAAMEHAGKHFDVAVLELPYIFGIQPGRRPVWVILVEIIKKMKIVTLFPKGGTAMVTVRQVGQAVAGALERNRGGHCYPIGYANMTWSEMLKIVHKYMGCPERKIITIPKWMFTLYGKKLSREQKEKNIEGGLDLGRYADVQCSELFIDRSLGCDPLGVLPDDIDRAIGASIRLCMEIIDNHLQALDMKGEQA